MEKAYNEDEIEIDLVELLLALKKRLVLIIAAIAAGGLLAGAITHFLITPKYSATSMMLVLTKETTLSSLADLQIGSQLTNDYSILVRSRPVLQEVIDNLGLDMTYQELERSIQIDNPEDARILEITVTYTDPVMVKEIVDELTEISAAFIGEQMEVVPPKIIEDGEVPTSPTSPSLMKNVVIGAMAAGLAAAGIVVLITILNDTIKTEDDIVKYLDIPALGSVPEREAHDSSRSTAKKKKKKKRRRGK